ncbi:MAG: M48 family metalloprotease [Planctomycetaceae bacterium]|jgi:Zn-dependent protease with chaperone function|nr:M48 family metalloprotease [Planctomycetaceae bacterium]
MDFFEQQRQARRRTGWLVLLFFVSIFIVGVGVHVGVMSFILVTDEKYTGSKFEGLWEHPACLVVFYASQFSVTVFVCLGSLCAIYNLSKGGGEYVAELLGGKEISPFTFRFEEKQLLNIVEEMAIAAGVIVPAVFVLEKEHRINSFVAGFDQDSAVIGVTRGALDYLTREELQALVAGEFSHILNGDIILNTRMIGILYGLSMVSQVGMAMSFLHPSLNREDQEEESLFVFFFFHHPALWITFMSGITMIILGSIGLLLGAMIKAAISRQRKFLADAATVQFTRNPGAIKRLFLKIGCPRVGSLVYSAHALEASHLFLGNVFGRTQHWNPLSSHPSWTSRIRRIDRNFDGKFPESVKKIKRYGNEAVTGAPTEALIDELLHSTNPRLGRFFVRQRVADAEAKKRNTAEEKVTELTGKPETAAKTPVIPTPPIITESLETLDGCCALIYALLLDKEPLHRKEQLEELVRILPDNMFSRLEAISAEIVKTFSIEQTMAKTPEARKWRSAFIRIRNAALRDGLPKLRHFSDTQYAVFRRICSHLTGNIDKVNLFRYSLFANFRNDLDEQFHYGKSYVRGTLYYSVSAIEPSLRLALSYLAYAGHANLVEAEDAFRAGLRIVGLRCTVLHGKLLPINDCTFRTFDTALQRLQDASPPIRAKCLQAFQSVLWNDGKMTTREEEIFLAVSAILSTENDFAIDANL